jgi:hypothetical protein
MVKRTLALLVGLVLTALFGLVSPGAAVAAPAGEVAVAASPDCSGTGSWGKIRYQVCQRWNCDSTHCYHRGYLGLINTATSARTVEWWMVHQVAGSSTEWRDGRESVRLEAGQQKTIFTDPTYHESCGITVTRKLWIQYDSAGWSPPLAVTSPMPCV